ncbi:hypothetical protein [Hyalangium sp.]|uniref:hypothetical protein n=1 Tax=Hyalangium sp. TaxID=2028555 RepID=UPI002D528299|nr:hypothetical protein [Hyalangium sp.]HYI00145.1 hypothetical protein [Hyalangium sp.]
MKNTKKFLAAGLLAGALTFIGCKSDSSAERTEGTPDTTQTTPSTGTPGEGSTTEGTSTGTETPPPGTGGSGESDISKTKQSDDNLRMPEEDPLRTPENESIRDAEKESEPGVHDEPGTGGAGFGNDALEPTEDNLNEGGNVDDMFRVPDSPADTTPEDGLTEDTQLPEGAR